MIGLEKNITIDIINDENIGLCRELCNELMSFQQSKAVMAPESFDSMNFDTRMKSSYDSALRKQVLVAKDGDKAVGYIFSTIDNVTENARTSIPDWAPTGKDYIGFYPYWLKLPQKIGCLSNLYIQEAYKGSGLGSKLFDMAMKWLGSFPDCDLTFVYISNGNDRAYDFYIHRGFVYSHEVYGGFITAAYYKHPKGNHFENPASAD